MSFGSEAISWIAGQPSMKLLFWLFVAVVAVVLALFTVTNRAAVSLGLWPLPFAIDLPLYLTIFAALLIGFVAGTLCLWLAGRPARRESRRRGRRIAALERELAATQARLPVASGNPPARLVARG
jgi:lipopolysaccharide assembly protein A